MAALAEGEPDDDPAVEPNNAAGGMAIDPGCDGVEDEVDSVEATALVPDSVEGATVGASSKGLQTDSFSKRS